jgi:hypothetical protein
LDVTNGGAVVAKQVVVGSLVTLAGQGVFGNVTNRVREPAGTIPAGGDGKSLI